MYFLSVRFILLMLICFFSFRFYLLTTTKEREDLALILPSTFFCAAFVYIISLHLQEPRDKLFRLSQECTVIIIPLLDVLFFLG